MTKPREKTREEVTIKIEDGKKKIRQLENREKVLRQKLEVSLPFHAVYLPAGEEGGGSYQYY